MPDRDKDNLAPAGETSAGTRPFRAGVLTNPRSGGNRKRSRDLARVLAAWPHVLHRQASTPDEVAVALADFSGNGIELIVINGGDGTAQAVFTVIGNTGMFARPPLFAMLCAGTTSMLSRDAGVAGDHIRALQRTLSWAQAPDTSMTVGERFLVRVERPSGNPLHGMFFGAGAICEGIRIFHSKDNPMGWRGQIMPAMTMLRLLLAILRRDNDRVPAFPNRTGLDDGQAERREDLFAMVSTLDRLFLGMRPYWGDEPGALRYTAVTRQPKCLLRVLASLFGKQISRHAQPANGFFSHNAQRITLDMQGDFTLDGELYPAGDGPLVLTPAGPMSFLCSP